MIKILFIHHATGWGGAPKSMISLINSLDKKRYCATVLLLRDSIVSKKLEESGINYVVAKSKFYQKFYSFFNHSEAGYVKWYNLPKMLKLSVIWLLSKYYFVPNELKDSNYDIVHLNSSVLTDWLKYSSKISKTIIHIREPVRKGFMDLRYIIFRKQMNDYADMIISISEDNALRINLPDKTKTVYNYSNIPKHTPLKESYKSKKFLYLGGNAKIKGFYTMVDSLKYIDDGIQIYFGGNYNLNIQNEKHKNLKAIQKMRSDQKAIEIGLIQNVSKYLLNICCLISPFTKPHFSRPIIEAHLHKKPVICSDIEGITEIVHNGVDGIIIEKDDAVKLATAINYLATEPEKAQELGENGYKSAIQKFTSSNILKIQSIYDQILKI